MNPTGIKSTGITRKIDELGRVVIPMELRKTLGIQERDPIEIFVNGEQIILRHSQTDPSGVAAARIVRKIDELGRLVIPSELRRMKGIQVRDSLEIFTDGSQIILMKYEPSCIFCQSNSEIVSFHDKNVCQHCIRELYQLL